MKCKQRGTRIQVKETKDRRLIYPRVIGWSRQLAGDASSHLAEISKYTGINLSIESLTEEDIKSAFLKINPNDKAPLLLGPVGSQYANWRQYLYYYRMRSKDNVSRIMGQLVFLDAELISLVSSIDDCTHFRVLDMTYQITISNQDLSSFCEKFYEYCVACLKLKKYIDRVS